MASYDQLLERAYQLQAESRAREEAQRVAQAEAARAAALEREQTRSRTGGEVLQDVGVQLLQGAVGLGQAAYGLGNIATLGTLDRAVGLSENFQETNQILNEWKSVPTQAALGRAQQAFEQEGVLAGLGAYVTSPAALQNLLVSNIPSLLPAAGAARLAGGIAAEGAVARGLTGQAAQQLVRDRAERALLTAAGGQTAGAVNVEAINQISAAGGDPTAQQLGGLGAGLLAGVATPVLGRLTGAARLEAAAANALPGGAGTLGVTSGLLRGGAVGAGREATEETLQSGAEQLAVNVVTPGRGLWEGVGEQSALGGLAGGLLGGGLGAFTGLRSPRVETPLRTDLRETLREANASLGSPLGGSAVVDPEVPGGLTDIDTGPLDIEEVDIGAVPTPLRSLYDITGRRPQVTPLAPPLPIVEELPAPARTGLLGVIDAQQGRGRLGGTDLFAGPLPPEGAFPAAAAVPTVSPEAPSTTAPGQRAIDFDAPAPTWKQALARELGLKPGNFRGKAWDQFVAAAESTGVDPTSPTANEFLRSVVPQIAGDPASAPIFAARLAEKYAPQALETPGTPRTLADALAMAEDDYIRAVNPEGKTTAEDDVITLRSGDLELPSQTVPVEVFQDRDGNTVQVVQDAAGVMYAVRDGDVLGAMEPGDTDTLLNVVQEAQGQGIGTGLAAAFVRQNPFAQAGSFSPGGEATRRAAFRKLQRELAPPAEVQVVAEVTEAAAQANQVPSLLAPTAPTEPIADVLEGLPPTPIGLDAAITRQSILDPTASESQQAADAMMDMMADATSPDVLDETFIAVKNHPAWGTLDDAQRTEIAEEFEQRYARITSDPGKFNRNPDVASPISVDAFRRLTTNALRNRGPNDPEIIPLESVGDFELQTGQAAPQDAAGVYVDGRVYLIRENIRDTKDYAFTLAHERGHHGLSVLLGDRMPAVLNRLWANAAIRGEIKAKMKVIGQTDNPEAGGLRRLAAEEVLADKLASGAQVNGDVITKARNAVEGFFARLLGVGDLRMSNAEVDKLLRDVATVLQGRTADVGEETPGPVQGLEDVRNVMLVGDPGTPRFSQAKARINDATTAGDDGSAKSVDEATKTAVEGVMGSLADTRSKLASGSRNVLLDFAPLNWLAKYYGRLFTDQNGVDHLREVDRLSVGKEGSYAELLTHEHDLTFEGEKFRTSPQALAAEWYSYNLRNRGGETLARMMNAATLYKVWPQKAWDAQSDVNYAREGFSEAQRRAAYDDVRTLWNQVGKTGQDIFKKSQAIAGFQYKQYFAALSAEYAAASGNPVGSEAHRAGVGNLIDTALQRIRSGPYSSLQRTGDYLVTVRDAQGDVRFFAGYDTQAAAETAAAKLRERFPLDEQFSINSSLRRDFNYETVGIDRATTDRLRSIVDDMVGGDENSALRARIQDALVDLYMQSLPDRSYLNHAKTRRGTEGYGVDALRSFSDYSLKNASRTSSLRFDGRIRRELRTMDQLTREATTGAGDTNTAHMARVLNATTRQVEANQSQPTSAIPTWMSRIAFIKYMTSPSQMFINALQTINVTAPTLAAEYGGGTTLRALNTAMVDFTKSKGNLMGDQSVVRPGSMEARVLQRLQQTNQLDASFAYDLVSVAAGDAQKLYGLAGAAMRGLSWFMHRSEGFNRQVTALMATRLEAAKRGLGDTATDEQVQDIADKALDVIRTTHGDYSSTNAPTSFRGPWRRAILQFQKYRVNMLAMLGKEIRDAMPSSEVSLEERQQARRTLAWLVGTQLAFTGAAGSILAPVAFAIVDAFRDDDDLLDSRTEFLSMYPQWLTQGLVSSAFNIDLSRVGMNTLLPIIGDSAYAPNTERGKDSATYYLMQNLGPWAGLIVDTADGATKMMQGDSIGAIKGLAPKPFADLYRGGAEAIYGVRDARGVVYDEPGVWGTITTVAGLRSADRREAEGVRGASYEALQRASTLRTRYLNRLAIGYSTGDQELIDEAQTSIQQWNQSFPDMAIGANQIRRAVVNRVLSQQTAEQYGVPTPRLPQSVREAIGR